MMNIQTPPEWRKGQTIFNFLEWLATEKGYGTTMRMADPFYIKNNELENLYAEYIGQGPWVNKDEV